MKSCINGGDRKKRVKREDIERGQETGTKMDERFRKGRTNFDTEKRGKGMKMLMGES